MISYGIFKNLSGDSVILENFASQIVINDKYKYDLQPVYEEDGDLQSFVAINPLEEKEIILFNEIPNEAIHKKEKIVSNLAIIQIMITICIIISNPENT